MKGGVKVTSNEHKLTNANYNKMKVTLINQGLKSCSLTPPAPVATGSVPRWCKYLTAEKATENSSLNEPTKTDYTNEQDDESTKLPFQWGPIESSWKRRLLNMMKERQEVFSVGEWDLGCTDQAQHAINLLFI